MLHLEEKIAREIATYSLLDHSGRPVIVGLSGGADSVALLTALTALSYNCIAAHCNFHLRGDESDRDRIFAEKTAESLGATFMAVDFDVEAYIESCPGPVSVEMACRDLRYNWFADILAETDSQAIAVAHNSDDNIETSLLNLFRGTGISGLRAMLPRNDSGIIRPMLTCSRSEIIDYLSEKSMSYVTDSTNLQCDYTRNKLRNVVLPAIDENFPKARRGITTTIAHLQQTEAFLNRVLDQKLKLYSNDNGLSIDIRSLTADEPDAEFMLYSWLAPRGLSASQAADIIRSANESGRIFPVDRGRYIIDHGTLRFEPSATEALPSLDELYEISVHPRCEFHPERDGFTAYFEAESISPENFSVKYWAIADRIKPFGMKGSRKVSDIFTDAHIGLDRKSRIPLLTDGTEILWVTGLRASRLYPVTERTETFIKVRYIGPPLF